MRPGNSEDELSGRKVNRVRSRNKRVSRNLRSVKNEPAANQQSTFEQTEVSVGSGGLTIGSWRAIIYDMGRRGATEGGRGCAPSITVQPATAAAKVVLPEVTSSKFLLRQALRGLVGNVARRDATCRVLTLMSHGRFTIMRNGVFM